MRYTQIPTNAFEQMQLNAGILVSAFVPATGTISASNIIGATTGGVTFEATPTYNDYGADVDNFPENVLEMKRIDTWTAKLSGTFVTASADVVKRLLGAASIDSLDSTKIVPKSDLSAADFTDIWWIGDYSNYNGSANGGFVAVHLINSLSTGGFKIKSSDKSKGQFDFEFTAHYSASNIEMVPFEVYVKSGTSEADGYYMSVSSAAGSTAGKTNITVSVSKGSGEHYVYQTGYNLSVPYAGAVLAGSVWTTWNGTDPLTAATGMDVVVAIADATNISKHAGKAIVVSND